MSLALHRSSILFQGLTVAVHATVFELALEPRPIEAGEDARTLEFPLHEFTFIPEQEKEKKNNIVIIIMWHI